MSRTVTSNNILDAFLDSLKSHNVSVETMANLAAQQTDSILFGLFKRLGRANRNIYLIRGFALINVHVRSELRGWWNIDRDVKRDLDILQKN